MYRLIHVNKEDKVIDATYGSDGFLVNAMSKIIKEAGQIKFNRAKNIKSFHGRTNIEYLATRTENSWKWIKSKNITKV